MFPTRIPFRAAALVLFIVALCVTAPSPAWADTVTTADGKVFDGVIVERDRDGFLEIFTRDEDFIRIPRANVETAEEDGHPDWRAAWLRVAELRRENDRLRARVVDLRVEVRRLEEELALPAPDRPGGGNDDDDDDDNGDDQPDDEPAGGPRVEVVDKELTTHGARGFTVNGAIQNLGGEEAEDVSLVLVLLDADGNLVDTMVREFGDMAVREAALFEFTVRPPLSGKTRKWSLRVRHVGREDDR